MSPLPPDNSPFDLIVRGGLVLDGTGAEAFPADIAVRGDRIVFVGTLPEDATSGRIVNANGRVVCPGFIDIHTHSDRSVLYTPGMESSLAQGVTTEVVGNCGFSFGLMTTAERFHTEANLLARGGVAIDWADMGGFLGRVENQGIALNVASLAGHGTLRKRVMGLVNRLPDTAESVAMQRELERALIQGAIGLSSGLEYVPGMYADVDEMVPLARLAAQSGGFYATHLRDEGDTLEEAVLEAITVAEKAGCPLQLSHHKAEKPHNWGKITRTLAMVDAARERGMDVLLDQYPYTAYQTGLTTIALPPWAVAGTPELLAERLSDPEMRATVRAAMPAVDWSAVEISSIATHREYQSKTIAHLATEAGHDARDWILDLFSEGVFVAAVHFALSEEDVTHILRDPRVIIGSDAVADTPTGPTAADRPHPRTYGTFARVLGHYVRDRSVLSLTEAVRRMTSLPAQRIGWPDRGRLAPGCAADIVVFNPETICDTANFTEPHAFATGVEYVVVNGTVAWADGAPTAARGGRVLRR
jgi:N-acyl-D-amino-acid deacylase